MEIPRGFRGGGEKKSKNLKKKVEFPKCGGRGSAEPASVTHKGPDINISATCQFYKAKKSICKKIQQIQLDNINDTKMKTTFILCHKSLIFFLLFFRKLLKPTSSLL